MSNNASKPKSQEGIELSIIIWPLNIPHIKSASNGVILNNVHCTPKNRLLLLCLRIKKLRTWGMSEDAEREMRSASIKRLPYAASELLESSWWSLQYFKAFLSKLLNEIVVLMLNWIYHMKRAWNNRERYTNRYKGIEWYWKSQRDRYTLSRKKCAFRSMQDI